MTNSVFERLVECLGTKVEIARVCGVRAPTIHGWSQIPAHHVLKLEAAVKAKGGTIDRYSMRPDIYGQSPESIEQASGA